MPGYKLKIHKTGKIIDYDGWPLIRDFIIFLPFLIMLHFVKPSLPDTNMFKKMNSVETVFNAGISELFLTIAYWFVFSGMLIAMSLLIYIFGG